jgi:hypothetical protein
MHLSLNFLVLRSMILYNIMILVSSLSSLIDAPHQLFTCIVTRIYIIADLLILRRLRIS